MNAMKEPRPRTSAGQGARVSAVEAAIAEVLLRIAMSIDADKQDLSGRG